MLLVEVPLVSPNGSHDLTMSNPGAADSVTHGARAEGYQGTCTAFSDCFKRAAIQSLTPDCRRNAAAAETLLLRLVVGYDVAYALGGAGAAGAAAAGWAGAGQRLPGPSRPSAVASTTRPRCVVGLTMVWIPARHLASPRSLLPRTHITTPAAPVRVMSLTIVWIPARHLASSHSTLVPHTHITTPAAPVTAAVAREGDIVTADIEVLLEDGTPMASTFDQGRVRFRLGKGGLTPYVHTVILGMAEREAKTAPVPQDEAYGAYYPELTADIPIESGPPGLKVGDKVRFQPSSPFFHRACCAVDGWLVQHHATQTRRCTQHCQRQVKLTNGLNARVTKMDEAKGTFTIDANLPNAGRTLTVKATLQVGLEGGRHEERLLLLLAFFFVLEFVGDRSIDRMLKSNERREQAIEYLESGRFETVHLAAGCFWGLELAMQRIKGVVATAVGYTQVSMRLCMHITGSHRCGWVPAHSTPVSPDTTFFPQGPKEYPTYSEVCSGSTGHAEAVEVIFDPKEVSFADILEVSG